MSDESPSDTERFGPQIASPLFNPVAEATFDRATEAWGVEAQIVLAMEEASELNTELAREYRGRNDDEDVVDEIADVLIAARQLARIYGEEEVAERVRFKMDRLRERVEGADRDD